ncbi:MAG: tetratricopeptide repeat protein, partial [Pseudomonadota bacterium]
MLLSSQMVACSSLQKIESALFKNSTLHHLNPAPANMAPPEFANEDGPETDGTYKQSQADYHFTLAEAYSLEGRSENAIAEFKLALIYDPNSAMVRMRLAAEYIRQGLLSESIEQTEKAVEADPDNIDARLLLGGLYSSLKMFDLAMAQYKSILKIAPKNTEAPIFIGAILAEKKQYDEAITYFEKLTKDPSYTEPEKAWYYMGRIYLERDEEKYGKKAKQALLNSIRAKPSYIDSVMALAMYYEKNDQEPQSVKLLESYQEKFG